VAHDPLTKARVVADLLTGMSCREAARVHNIKAGTVLDWANDLNKLEKQSIPAIRHSTYQEALELFVSKSLGMLSAQADHLSDPDVIKDRSTSDVVRHSQFIFDKLEFFVRLHSGSDGVAISKYTEVDSSVGSSVVPDLVEGDCS